MRKYCHPSHVVVLYDCNSSETTGGTLLGDEVPLPPDVDESSKLQVERGEVLKVLSESLDWWIVCHSSRTGDTGYVSTLHCAPFEPR